MQPTHSPYCTRHVNRNRSALILKVFIANYGNHLRWTTRSYFRMMKFSFTVLCEYFMTENEWEWVGANLQRNLVALYRWLHVSDQKTMSIFYIQHLVCIYCMCNVGWSVGGQSSASSRGKKKLFLNLTTLGGSSCSTFQRAGGQTDCVQDGRSHY